MEEKNFRIYDSVTDRKIWKESIDRFSSKLRDIYFYPEFLNMDRMTTKSRALLFNFKKGRETFLYPFLIRPIQTGRHTHEKKKYFDISSAYGYGGPLSSTDNKNFISEGHSLFKEWCGQNNVVVEFIRFHPLIESKNWLTSDIQRKFDRKTTSIKLTRYTSNLTSKKKNVWRKIRRGQNLGMKTIRLNGKANFQQFLKIYRKTMRRLGAEKEYYFNKPYFDALEKIVKKSGLLIAAMKGKAWVSAAIFLVGEKWMHYHLSASDPSISLPHATCMVIHEAAQWGSDHGHHVLHLGGGRSTDPDDSLLQFKRSIADDFHDFYIGKRIFKSEIYASLKKEWLADHPHLRKKHGSKTLFYRFNS